MTPEHWRHIKRVFQEAMEMPADERTAFVERESAADIQAREQIMSLLRAHAEAADFIEEPVLVDSPLLACAPAPTTQPMDDEDDALAERRIGEYRIVRELGRGGMGAVYLAVRADGEFRQQVAIKLIKRGMDTDFVLRRFRNERQILASLDHPNIARLIGGGSTDDGLPYFVMEYVAGVPLHEYCDRERLTIDDRLKLFCQICGAITHAHRKGVVHRDIKPGNILVTADGALKLLDFGIAKLLNPDLAAQTLDPTLTALRLMTPEYASPEQVCGGEITPASDVYSLGVVLYEMLTGHRPHIFKNRSPHEISRVICEVEPEAPSRVVSRSEARTLLPGRENQETTLDFICRARRAGVEELRREIAGNLDRITLRALRKPAEERYPEVEEMCADIERHFSGQPVSASIRIEMETGERQKSRRRAVTAGAERALAVLPFKLLNPSAVTETGDDYLGLGLADALITRLGSLRRFVVRPTSSVLRFQNGEAGDPLAAGRELSASFVLDGRIQRAGAMLRVTAQLLDVETGATRWAQVFDEKATDVLALQDNLTARVAEALVPHLSRDEREQLAKRGTDNPEAFEAYLRGRYHWSTFTEEGFAKAITSYYRAIALDPEYALAYTGVADYHNWLGVYNVLPSNECFAAATEAARRAIELDPELAEAHTALGFALVGGYAWKEAERHHLRALELDPNCVTAHVWYSLQLAMEGRAEESIASARLSVELDPLAPFNRYNLGWILYQARRYDESVETLRKLLADEPSYGIAQFGYGWALASTGRYDEAITALRRARDTMPGVSFVYAGLAVAYAGAGDEQEARRVLTDLRGMATGRFITPYHLALVHAVLGEQEETLERLEEAYELRDAWIAWLGVEPLFDFLRDDARYTELLRLTMNPSVARHTGAQLKRHAASLPSKRDGAADAGIHTSVHTSVPTPLPTSSGEAYQLYVAGRYYSTRRNADGMRQAIAKFERATELDPNFALAYAELADCYALLNWYVEPPPPDAFERARQAALRAIEADDNLADAHASLGLIKLHYERDWDGAEREFRRAIELKPDNPVAHRWYAFSLSAAGRHEDAIAEIHRARRIAPRSPVVATAVANVLFFARRYDDAIAQCHKALELDAGSVAAYVVLRWSYGMKGMKDEALAAFEQERVFAGDTPTTRAKQAHVLAACDQHDESRAVLRELLSRHEEIEVTSYEIAVIYSLLGDKDAAIGWLTQAEQEHTVGLTFAAVDPHLDNLREDARFAELLQRTNILKRTGDYAAEDGSLRERSIHDTGNAAPRRPNQTGGLSEPVTKSSLPQTGEIEHRPPSIPNTVEVAAAPRRRIPAWAAAAAALVFVAATSLVWFTDSEHDSPMGFRAAQSAKLTTTGNAVAAALSPDGKYVAYTVEEGGRQSLWVRQTSIANSIRVVAGAATEYRGLTFSPDGAHIYYVAAAKSEPNKNVLYKVPALGGSAVRLRDRVDSPVAITPDGKRFAFVRRDEANGKDALIITEEANREEREIAARVFPEHISIAYAPAWSADGSAVAFAAEGSDSHGSFMRANDAPVAGGSERPLSAKRWLTIGQMAWLPGGESLVIAAQEENSSFTQLWQLTPRGDERHKLTDDLADYRGVSLSADAKALVSVRREMLTSVWVAPENDPSRFVQITTGAGRYFDCSWTPDGKIIYASDASGSADIWEMDADGTGQRQLTAGAGRNYAPVVSSDNEFIVFHSDRTGEWQLWRMTREGDEPTQLTGGGEDSNWAQITPDNQTVIYEHTSAGAPVTLWSVPLAGGTPAPLTRELASRPVISPDGASVAYWHRGATPNSPWGIAIRKLGADDRTQLLDLPQGIANGITQLRWTRDGGAVMYLDYRDGTTTLWRQPLNGSARMKLLESPGNMLVHSFDLDARGRFALSRGLMINDVVFINNTAPLRSE